MKYLTVANTIPSKFLRYTILLCHLKTDSPLKPDVSSGSDNGMLINISALCIHEI